MRAAIQRLTEFVARPLVPLARYVYGTRPLRPERNALEFALFAAIVAGNFRTAIGGQALPNSLSQTPDVFGITTAALMVVGSMVTLVGLVHRDNSLRLFIEQLGLGLAGLGLLFYGFALIHAGSWANAAVAVSLSWGVSLGTGLRYAQIWWYLRQRGSQ